ncbi:MAG: trehalose-phosphatase [Candidatus Omnitrophica bacterium]|nr:trehalose-phosphatase [Candidatus Omnitrophota bacterium]MCA9426272.1 trehalose-phosphatase [Candidatus Omnitrophota bacterium]MCA9430311.1 trehalose-phosphatase [Candidatus Omnitrophota bacterium]MCA9436585.1 trehalose-phosphatase [Candidatus Omnitrophota bacterium]MCB9769986.1 trehalose-phosphatase [Candidatus Omnitrophota bacterium]
MADKLSNNYVNETKSHLKRSNLVLLVCDYDGALLQPSPDGGEGHMAETVHDHLEKISAIDAVRLAIITGRSPLNMREQVQIPNCHYLCNHGLEISGPELNFRHSVAEKMREHVHEAANTLRVQLRIDRAVVEDRGLTAVLNYRNVMESHVSSLMAKTKNLLANAVRERKIRIEEGRRTLEIMPAVDWDRGKAVKMLHHTLRAEYPGSQVGLLYVGAGGMDETAFKYVIQVGIPYRVTQTKTTSARYYLKMQTEISRVLKLVRENAPQEAPAKPKEKMVL